MKLDATRYAMFWNNPERFRIRQLWKLKPEEPKPGTMAALFTYGRKRGTCFHELMDADYRKVPRPLAIADLRAAGFETKEIAAAERLSAEVLRRYPDLEMLAHEQLFEVEVGRHVMTGRIDHICRRDGAVWVGDYKTMRRFSKKETAEKAAAYCASPQVDFYLIAARSMGYETNEFIYRLCIDDTKKNLVDIQEHPTTRPSLRLEAFARNFEMTCDLIDWLVTEYGTMKPWPNMHEKFDRGYQAIAGRNLYEGWIPEGFERAEEFLETMEEEPEESVV